MPERYPSLGSPGQLFSSKVPLDRVIAAREAKNYGNRYLSELKDALEDEYYEVRGNAALSLGQLQVRSSVPDIIDLLSDEVEEVRYCAAQALGYLGDPSAIVPLLRSLSDYSRETRIQATKALAKMPKNELGENILNHLDSINPVDIEQNNEASILKIDIARGIMEAMTAFSGEWVSSVLEFGLNSEDLEMARLAAISVGKCGINEFTPNLVDRLVTDDDDLRWGLIYALCQLEFNDKAEILGSHVNDSYEFIREQVCLHLYQISENVDVSPMLRNLADDESPIVRSAVGQCIAQLKDNYTSILKLLLNDSNPYVRQQAVTTIAEKEASTALAHLERLAEKEGDELVQVAITNALDKLTSK